MWPTVQYIRLIEIYFRYGAPFYHRFHKLTLQLDANGITNHWLNELITQRIKENRDKNNMNKNTRVPQNDQVRMGMSLRAMELKLC